MIFVGICLPPVFGEPLMNSQTPALMSGLDGSSSKIKISHSKRLQDDMPDSAGAITHALDLLERELPDYLYYHNLFHIQSDVLPALERLATLEEIDANSLVLLRTAAAFHDIGFVISSETHEEYSKQIANEVLPLFEYTNRQIEIIQALIETTKLPQKPHNLLEQIMADADLDVLGRPDFLSRSDALRSEILALGKQMTDIEWYTSQLQFTTTHRYFTKSACNLRNARKQKNINDLERLLHLALSS
jgi:uncharacterized protein